MPWTLILPNPLPPHEHDFPRQIDLDAVRMQGAGFGSLWTCECGAVFKYSGLNGVFIIWVRA